MYPQPKEQYVTSLTGNMPAPTRQVDGALDSVNGSLDALLDTVNELVRRLEPVTGGCPEGDTGDTGESPSSLLVPIAARIRYIDSRVMEMRDLLVRALNALEI